MRNISAPRDVSHVHISNAAQSFLNKTKGRQTEMVGSPLQVMNEDASLNGKRTDLLSVLTLEKMSKEELIKVIQQLQVQLQTSDATIESKERE